MLDISNLMIKFRTRTRFLSPNAVYGVHLVFKFCDSRKFSSTLTYVNLKYMIGSETSHAYFATTRDDEWMMIELFRFLNHKEHTVVKFLLESLSPCYCGDGAIYVEGIEYRAIDNDDIEKLIETLNVDQEPPTNDEETINMQEKYVPGEKLLLKELYGKKHLMLSAKAALYDFSNVRLFKLKQSPQSRFQELIEFLPQQAFRINCTIQSEMLSRDTEYACYLVFQLSENCQGLHCPVKVRDLLHRENEEEEILYFISPSPWNLHDIFHIPKQRGDGCMEVKVWKFNSIHESKSDRLHVNLKLASYDGYMSGLIVCGLEFRPT